jgi:multiple sugar transport system permease protein
VGAVPGHARVHAAAAAHLQPLGALPGRCAIAASAALHRPPVPAAIRRRRLLVAVATHSGLIACSIAFLAPFAFIVLTALMSDLQAGGQSLWPHPFRWGNFATVIRSFPVLRYAGNTLLYAGLATLGVLVSSVPVAYALAKLRWRLRGFFFLLVLATMMLPYQVTAVSLYVIFTRVHWVGTLLPLIVPNFFGDAFSIFLLRQFFMTLPEDYLDAARVDGASDLQILRRVVIPMAKPALAAVALFNFLYAWNDFFGPLLYVLNNQANWTLSVALTQFRTLHRVEWNLTMAAVVLVMIPVISLFFFAQRAFIEGVTLTGVKG